MTAKTPSSTGQEMGNRTKLPRYRRAILFAIAEAVLVSQFAGLHYLGPTGSPKPDSNCGCRAVEWSWDPHGSAEQHAALIEQASTSIANGESGVLVLAVSTDLTKEVVLRLRRTGVNPVILGGTSLGSDFPQRFRDQPEEEREPGYFTNNTYLASPLLLDSSSERSLEFSERLFSRYGFRADEVSAKYY